MDLLRGLDAVEQGQSIVEHGHIGLSGDGFGNSVLAVGRQ